MRIAQIHAGMFLTGSVLQMKPDLRIIPHGRSGLITVGHRMYKDLKIITERNERMSSIEIPVVHKHLHNNDGK
jgi:hypothetical protein